jgi:hypothetical protein
MGTINNSSGASSYSNFTSISTNVSVGIPTAITVTVGNLYTSDKVFIWCDWNRNGTLTDAGEAVYASVAGGPFGTNITPPAGTTVGAVRMRIRLTDSQFGPNTTPCGTSSYGEVEDYTLNVTGSMMPEPVGSGNGPVADAPAPLRSETLSIFPNPTSGSCTITATSAGTYYLMNEMGVLVRSFTLDASNGKSIQLDDLGSGTYVISGQTKTGIVKQKLVVNR